jgi:hypothetical protein
MVNSSHWAIVPDVGAALTSSGGPRSQRIERSDSSTWSVRGLPSNPTRPQSSRRYVVSEFSWTSRIRLPASIAWICPLSTKTESPDATETLFTQSSAVPAETAFSKAARVTPAFSPTKREAPGTECATYQFSALASPPSALATSAGGWTWRLRRSEQSSHFTRSGKRLFLGHSGPISLSEWRSISSCSFIPLYEPPRTTDWASGLSVISQLSPMGFPAGSLRPRSDSRRRPPHTRSW